MILARLRAFIPICKAIATLLPVQVEVVLHDLREARIVRTYRKRVLAAQARRRQRDRDRGLSIRTDIRHTIGPYLKANPDGTRLRSVSALLRDDEGRPFALLCLNLRLAELEATRDVLAALTALDGNKTRDLLRNDWREVTNSIIAAPLRELTLSFNQVRCPERLVIIMRLLDADIFSERGSADYVADALGISRAIFFDLIKQAKQVEKTA